MNYKIPIGRTFWIEFGSIYYVISFYNVLTIPLLFKCLKLGPIDQYMHISIKLQKNEFTFFFLVTIKWDETSPISQPKGVILLEFPFPLKSKCEKGGLWVTFLWDRA